MQKLFLSLVTSLFLVSCASPGFDTSRLSPEYWHSQPYCVGRYQMQLPRNIEETAYDLFYGKDRISVLKDQSIRSVITDIQTIKNGDGIDYNTLYVFDKVLIPNKSYYYVSYHAFDWDLDVVRDFSNPYFTTLYHQIDNQWLYIIYSGFSVAASKGQEPANLADILQKNMQKEEDRFKTIYLDNIQYRARDTLPKQAGVCLSGGFLADTGKTPLVGDSNIVFSDLNDAKLSIYMGYPYDRKNIPLAKKDILSSSNEFVRTTSFEKYRIVREGARAVNAMSGYEKLLELDLGNYYFIWESNNQELKIELTKSAQRPGLTESQVIQAWDSILPTFKFHH